SSGQESNGLSPPARHYDSDSHRDTGIHRAASTLEDMDSGFASSMRPGMTTRESDWASSEFFHPGPQFHFPAPGAAWLLQHAPVAERDRIRIEKRIRPVGGVCARGAADAAINDEMRDVKALRRQLALHALREPAQREFSHRERCRLRV